MMITKWVFACFMEAIYQSYVNKFIIYKNDYFNAAHTVETTIDVG